MKKVIWITGLSSSGKSTLANNLVDRLRANGENIVKLDGDEIREVLNVAKSNSKNHNRTARIALAIKYAKLCKLIANQGLTVVCSTISMFKEVYLWNRENQPSYFEVYLKVPLSVLKNRDPKGIYKRFDAGELRDVAGMDLQVDEPESPDILFEFDPALKISEMVEDIIIKLKKNEC